MEIVTTLNGHRDAVNTLASWDSFLASGSDDGFLRVWTLDAGRGVRAMITPDNSPVNAICVDSKNSPEIYVACDNKVHAFDVRDPSIVSRNIAASITCYSDEINQLAISEDKHVLASADDAGNVNLVDRRTLRSLGRLKVCNSICSSIAFRPGHVSEMAAAGFDSTFSKWDWRVQSLLSTFSFASRSTIFLR